MREESKNRTSWKALLLLALILFVLAGIIRPQFEKAQAAGDRTIALSGCKALAGGLVSFKHEFGQYPCDTTRDLLIKKGLTNLPLGNDANAYLAQLIATEVIDSETYLHCKAGKGYHKGDDKIDTPETILAPGENSYAYVMAQGGKSLSHVPSITPIVIAPILSGGSTPTFDPTLFGKYYVYGAVDGSGKQGKVSPTGLAKSKGRDHLFQTGENSLFELPLRHPNPRRQNPHPQILTHHVLLAPKRLRLAPPSLRPRSPRCSCCHNHTLFLGEF